ncbi:hypothetical protein C7446_2815 [Kushneria sinocarnis]|uniref:Uncharacterized protein n=1 Tax=Kushneria sinocarnis TaxID=595502 RepID=A0A420WU36_9GAMM|nr:hypothetical protein C7446_2815 [Kushneria sinocarnis]
MMLPSEFIPQHDRGTFLNLDKVFGEFNTPVGTGSRFGNLENDASAHEKRLFPRQNESEKS